MTCPDCAELAANYANLNQAHRYLLAVLDVRDGQIQRLEFAVDRLERELAEHRPDPVLEAKNRAVMALRKEQDR